MMKKKLPYTYSQDIELMSMTPIEVADYLSISVRTLAKWRSIGSPNIPYIKVGRCIRYKKSDLEAYLDEHTVNGEGA